MMTLYIGMHREAGRRLLVAQRSTGLTTYELCWQGPAEELEELGFAVLARHLDDGRRARSLCVRFMWLMGARLDANFWTLRPGEIDEAIARLA